MASGTNWYKFEYTGCSDCQEQVGQNPDDHSITLELEEQYIGCGGTLWTGVYEVEANIYFCPPLQNDMSNFVIGTAIVRGSGSGEVAQEQFKVITNQSGQTITSWGRAVWQCNDDVDFLPVSIDITWGDLQTGQSDAAKGHVPDSMDVFVRCCQSGD